MSNNILINKRQTSQKKVMKIEIKSRHFISLFSLSYCLGREEISKKKGP